MNSIDIEAMSLFVTVFAHELFMRVFVTKRHFVSILLCVYTHFVSILLCVYTVALLISNYYSAC